mgnify:CR=1 FL=1
MLTAAALVVRADARMDGIELDHETAHNRIAFLLHMYRAGDERTCYAVDLAHDALSVGAHDAEQRPSRRAHVRMRPALHPAYRTDGYAVDWYDGRGKWTGTTFLDDKAAARRELRRARRVIMRDD